MKPTPIWVLEYKEDKRLRSYTESTEIKTWKRQAKTWWEKYLKEIGATDFDFHSMYCEFSAFFRIGDRWWYISSGDIRYKIFDWMLLRTATGPKDYVGGMNQQIPYGEGFVDHLEMILGI